MNNKPLVCCLCATYGRFSLLCEAVTCFVEQDYENKKLLILNSAPVPLTCNLHNVTVYNEQGYTTLGVIRNRLLNLSDGDYIRTWDDDDLYLPWAISQGVEHIGDSAAWKPKYSWFYNKNEPIRLVTNIMESSILIKEDIAKKYRYNDKISIGEQLQLLDAINKYEKGLIEKDMGLLASYVYRWGFGHTHVSNISDKSIDNKDFTERNKDFGTGEIQLVELKKYWELFTDSFNAHALKYPNLNLLFELTNKEYVKW